MPEEFKKLSWEFLGQPPCTHARARNRGEISSDIVRPRPTGLDGRDSPLP
jgi:hypothetical protein